MTITVDTIIQLSKVIGALGVIFGVVIAFVKWLSKQEKQTKDIKELKEHHNDDLKNVQEELCVVNYAVLASLDALIQNGYNGKVTEAHDKLQKHINKKAHGQDGV
jgi:predicted histidine transporter YuiF (NhaC family)